MSERDSLLDLDINPDDTDTSVFNLDNSSPTLPPDRFPYREKEHAKARHAIDPIDTEKGKYSPILDPGVPVEHIEARQAETTKPIKRIDVEDLSEGIPQEPMVRRISEMSIEALMDEPGERIALLLAKI